MTWQVLFCYRQQRLLPEMNLMLQVTFLGLLSLLVQGWVQNRSLQSERWSELDLLQNRELFLSALQSYFSSRGIHIEKAAPAFVLSTRNRNQGDQEERELVAPKRGVDD
ncbi:EF-hand calcium-binding domain-containing protein 7 [Platysternon megacephalum]|uniref:EF-hand calcium-binding domain-containing protein 7 n=1 Tax=Platysternon megacephalum TaxID=55544 RepID=A0A4D9EJ65_9SAUR|nr:EF-hand calcium-binding domain-containing protein 7 [Platysternon megacephalum]